MTDVQPVADLPHTTALLHRWNNEADLAKASGADAAMQIFETIVGAETEEELFAAQDAGSVASKDFLNRPFLLLPENIMKMRAGAEIIKDGGFPFYVLLRVRDLQTDTDVVLNSGAQSVIGVLDRLMAWERERPEAKKPFQPYRPAGRPFQFVGKATLSGQDVVMLKPFALPPANGKTTRK